MSVKFLKKFFTGCLIGFFALILSKVLSSLTFEQSLSLRLDFIFFAWVFVGGIGYALLVSINQKAE